MTGIRFQTELRRTQAKLSDQAIAIRDLAKRARRLAVTTLAEDAAWLLRYADDLEAQAVDLEKRARKDD